MRRRPPIRSLLLLLLALAAPAPASAEAGPGPRGIAVLSSAVGHGVSAEELETFVRTCRIDLVVFDFAWITGLWPQTDLAAVEDLAKRLKARGVAVAAMYRPRALSPSDADVGYARDEEGRVAEDHNELCFADERSVEWGASWGERILAACPSIDRLVLYNVRARCRCEKCEGGSGLEHAKAFVAKAAARFREVRPGVTVGHVGGGVEYVESVDFLWPFLSVLRADEKTPIDAAALVHRVERVRERARGKPVVPLAKICWESQTQNTTEDVAAVIRECGRASAGFVLWYYSWLFHSRTGRYDPQALVAALGGEWDAVAEFLTPRAAEPEPAPEWIWFDSRESEDGPRLLAGPPRAKAREFGAVADSVLISYLADVAHGRLPKLSVSLGDTNRVLVRFCLKRVRPGTPVRLRLRVHLSEAPPTEAFDLAVHALIEDWDESTATWNHPPAFEAEPAAVVRIEPEEGTVEIDLTGLAKEWILRRRENHGLLLKVAKPVMRTNSPPPPPARSEGEELLDRALAAWPWAPTAAAARARAEVDGKLVLAVVTAVSPSRERTEQEDLFLSTVLCHPGVVRYGTDHFVPVRIHYPPAAHTAPAEAPPGPDPLAPLGTSVAELKAPALLVSDPAGKRVATLPAIGTFDHRLVLRFLRAASRDAPVPPAPRGEDRIEQEYWRAARLWREGKVAEAREILGRIAREHEESPWELKARLRLAFPERVDLAECIEPPALGERSTKTEVAVAEVDLPELLDLATDYLLDIQRVDGGWPVAEAPAVTFRPGVSVLAAHALLTRRDGARGERRRRIRAALDRADEWFGKHVAEADPRTLNSFAAAYYLDYLLAARAAKRVGRSDVKVAIRQLVGSQLGNGAWSYDRRFSEEWKGGFAGWPVTDKGRAHSVNAGLALLALADAKDAGFEVPEGVLESGRKALLAMRTAPARWTYTWPEPRNFDTGDSSIARAPLCEQALLRLGGGSRAALRKAMDLFMKYRADLRPPAKLSAAWLRPRCYSSYFYHFAYYHAARALAELDDDAAHRDLAMLRADLLTVVEPDGTWVDYPAIGKPYGTAMALLTLAK